MRLSIILPAVLASLSFAYSSENCSQYEQYEAIHQAEYKLANTLDTKNWDILYQSMTQDVVYDNSAFGPGKGGVSIRGLRSFALTTHPKGGWWTPKSPGQLNRHY